MTGWMLSLVLCLAVSKAYAANKRDRGIIPVVGFFQPDHPEQQLAFRIAVERINVDRGFLPNTTLVPRVELVTVFDSFNTSKRVCSLTKDGIGAIFGPDSVSTSGIVESICDTMEIPHIQTHWETSIRPANCMVNLYPDPKLISKALIDVIRDMDWKSFTILYEEHDGLVRLQDVLKEHNGLLSQGGTARGTPFTLRQLHASGDYRPLLKEIQNSSETHIVLDCATDKVIPLLQQAKEVKLMGDYNSYIITSLDAHTLDYGEFRYGKTNITALRLVDPTRRHVQTVVHDWVFEEERHGRNLELTPETVKLESALMYDAVNIYAKALHGLSSTQPIRVKSLSCDNVDKWPSGYSLVNYMKILEMEGMTGKIQFDAQGHRSFFLLEIIELAQHGFKKIGSWDPVYGINYTRTTSEMYSDIVQSIKDKTFIVSSRIGEPYLRKKEGEGLVGNDRYEGYSMDLIDAIAKELGFEYEFELVGDNKYGSLNKVTKQWDGLIKELMERRADLAICDLTITYDRRSAVDFTMPFMTLGISILYSKPVKKAPDLFSFLLPLSLEVWICMMTAYLGISLLLYFLARCSPYEWENPHPCNPDPEELEQTFNLPNCLWFSTGSLMAQGCDLLPKALSTRMVAGMWWFFTLIMIASYTANLAAALTSVRMNDPIESVEDLAKQNSIKYGVLKGGSTANFFMESNVSMYHRMWSMMESQGSAVIVEDNAKGVERVLKSELKYAYFMESTSIEYQIEKNCELKQVGGLLDSKGYGIAMPVDSPYRTAISGAVLKMQETNKLLEIKDKWWKEKKNGSVSCEVTESATDEESSKLGLDNVGGVFLVLILGCSTAFIVAILEFLWNVRKVAVTEKISPSEAFMLELKFAMRCHGSTKPVRPIPETKENSQHGSLIQLNVMDKFNIDEKNN